MAPFAILTYDEHPQEFLKYLESSNLENLPTVEQFKLESQYRQAETGEGFKDVSFCVLGTQKPEAFILAHKFKDFIGFNGSGVDIIEADYHKKRAKHVLQYLLATTVSENCQTLKIDDIDTGHSLSPLGQDIFNHQAVPDLKLRAVQNLTMSEEEIFLSIRSSYRSLINKSKNEMKFLHVTSDNIEKDLFDEFRAFHKEAAGRETRSIESWGVQFEMIQAGHAELIMGYMEPHGLVSSALFIDYSQTTSYAVAVYDRTLFDKPLAHANVYEGMMRAKRRGQKYFNLGIIPPYHLEKEKEYNIGYFKKGFSQKLSSFIQWSINV